MYDAKIKTRVKVSDLLETLKSNRTAHKETYARTLAAYRETAVEKLRKRADAIEVGTARSHFINLSVPTSYEKEYDYVIEMLETTTEETVELDWTQFRRYVKDEWDWKESFKTLSATYGV